MKKVTIILMVAALATLSHAATLSWSTIAPTVDEADIANFIGVSMDQRNIADGDDEGTFIAGGRQGQGQTFTTGSNAGGYALKAITLQHVTYTTWWSVDTGWTTYNGGRWVIEIGTISNDVFTPIATEEAYMDDSAPANGAGVDGTGQFFTLVLDSPVGLVANTEYAFSIDTTADFNLWDAPYCETNGDGRTSTNYSGGEAFSMRAVPVLSLPGRAIVCSTWTLRVPNMLYSLIRPMVIQKLRLIFQTVISPAIFHGPLQWTPTLFRYRVMTFMSIRIKQRYKVMTIVLKLPQRLSRLLNITRHI